MLKLYIQSQYDILSVYKHILWNQGPIFVVCQFFSGFGWLGMGGGLKGKRTPLKLILFETSYLSLQRLLKSLNDEDTDIGRFENATIC